MINFSYDGESNITHVVYTGNVDLQQTLQIPEKTDAIAGKQKVVLLLVDQRKGRVSFGANSVFLLEISKAIKRASEWTKEHDYIKLAGVPGSEWNAFYANTFKVLARYIDNFEVETFDTIEEAERWLLSD